MSDKKQFTKGVAVMNGDREKMKTQSEERLEYVKEMYIVRGMRYMEVVRLMAAKYDVTERAAKKYIERLRKKMVQTIDDQLGYHMQASLIRYNDLYNKAHAEGKWDVCMAIQTKIDKLTGLDVKRVEVKQDINQRSLSLDATQLAQTFSPDQIKLLLAQMNSKPDEQKRLE